MIFENNNEYKLPIKTLEKIWDNLTLLCDLKSWNRRATEFDEREYGGRMLPKFSA